MSYEVVNGVFRGTGLEQADTGKCYEHTELYVASLHWAMMTVTSIGYGDIVPQTVTEYSVCVVFMLIAGASWAVIIGGICGGRVFATGENTARVPVSTGPLKASISLGGGGAFLLGAAVAVATLWLTEVECPSATEASGSRLAGDLVLSRNLSPDLRRAASVAAWGACWIRWRLSKYDSAFR